MTQEEWNEMKALKEELKYRDCPNCKKLKEQLKSCDGCCLPQFYECENTDKCYKAENTALKKIGGYIRTRPRLEQFLDRLLRPVEIVTKKPVFGCHMCGQCVLHSTGMVCPMNCPKNIRNGPCGGVALDGSCEVYPEMKCVWTRAYTQSQRLIWPHEIHDLRPPVD